MGPKFYIVKKKQIKEGFFLRFLKFIRERHNERGRDIGRGRSKLPMGSPMQDLIPGP